MIVLAIDGLEYNFVTKWNIVEFKQATYGRHDVTIAIKEGDPIYTPLIWSSFLLGKPSYLYGIDYESLTYKKSLIGYGRLAFLYKIKRKLLNRNIRLRPLLQKLGLFKIGRIVNKLHEVEGLPPEAINHSLLGQARSLGFKVWVKDFPGLSAEVFGKYRVNVGTYLNSPVHERVRLLNEIFILSIKLLRECKGASKSNDLILYYTPLIDIANHMLCRPGNIKLMTILASYYKKLAREIQKELKCLNNNQIACIIVSDHGYDPFKHEHSTYGFWSINIPIKIKDKPRYITDFKNFILNLLNM